MNETILVLMVINFSVVYKQRVHIK